MRLVLLAVTVCVAGVLAGLAASSAAARTARQPPSSWFEPDFNLCKTASLAAIQKAAGMSSVRGYPNYGRQDPTAEYPWINTCNWFNPKYSVLLETFATGMPVARTQKASGALSAKPISVRVPGASKAIVWLWPRVEGTYAAELWAVYPQGVVLVSFDKTKRPTTAQLVAVLRLVTNTQ